MRINNDGEHNPGNSYNQLFMAFSDEIIELCAERVEITETSYVHVEEIENYIISFANSRAGEVGVLCGNKGVGKTSVISYLTNHYWQTKGCTCILVDLTKQEPGPEHFGDSFFEKDVNSQMQICDSIAQEIINTEIFAHHKAAFPGDTFSSIDFAPQLQSYCPELCPKEEDTLGAIPTASEVMKCAKETNKGRYYAFLLYYCTRHLGRTHVKFVFDQLDNQHPVFVLAIANRLAHLMKAVDHFSSADAANSRNTETCKLTPIISCRETTHKALKAIRPLVRGIDWFAFHLIHMDSSAMLGPVLLKRYHTKLQGKRWSPDDTKTITFNWGINGIKTKILQRDPFFKSILSAFSDYSRSELVLKLCNSDLTEALKATLMILRNRHRFFINTDMLFKIATVPDQERAEVARNAFTGTTLLKCLAYGNQETDAPVYPIKETKIPNLLQSHAHGGGRRASLAKIKIVQHFAVKSVYRSSSPSVDAGLLLENVVRSHSHLLGLQRSLIEAVIDELYSEGILDHGNGHCLPSDYNGSCWLVLTPRGACLWRQLRDNSVLVECHRDVAELNRNIEFHGKNHVWYMIPSEVCHFEEKVPDLPWICIQLWKIESTSFKQLTKIDQIAYLQHFESSFATEVIANGVMNSWKNLYSDMRNESLAAEFLALMKELLDDCENVRASALPDDDV